MGPTYQQQGSTLENPYLFHLISDEDDFYMKIVAFDEIYNLVSLTIF
jgi:hypothetical protein